MTPKKEDLETAGAALTGVDWCDPSMRQFGLCDCPADQRHDLDWSKFNADRESAGKASRMAGALASSADHRPAAEQHNTASNLHRMAAQQLAKTDASGAASHQAAAEAHASASEAHLKAAREKPVRANGSTPAYRVAAAKSAKATAAARAATEATFKDTKK